jgi:hypothetical protein
MFQPWHLAPTAREGFLATAVNEEAPGMDEQSVHREDFRLTVRLRG